MTMHQHSEYLSAAVAGLAAVLLASPTPGVAGPMAPNRGAVLSEQPIKPWPTLVRSLACTATGTWTDEFGSGPGSFTRTAKKHCHAPGVWTDAYGYTWTLRKSGSGQLTGKVNYHGNAECPHQVWPVTGTFEEKQFTVTATNPGGGGSCSSFFTYSLTIQ
jgi:hypothetical protein